MGSLFLICVLLILATNGAFCASSDGGEGAVIVSSNKVTVEHSVGGGYVPRGSFVMNLGADGKNYISDVDKVVLDSKLTPGFKKLLSSSDGLYQVRFRKEGQESFTHISIPACALQSSGFKEDILLYLSEDGSIVGANYQSPVIGLPRACDASLLHANTNFLTRIKIGEAQESMVIPVQATGPKPQGLAHVNVAIKDDKGRDVPDAAVAPQQSFLRKYWWMILAALVYTLLSPAEAPSKGKPAAKKD